MFRVYARVSDHAATTEAEMNAPDKVDFDQAKQELIAYALKSGALVAGVADAQAFTAAPQEYRPNDLLPKATSVLVIGGAQPRAGDWQSPNYQHMEVTSTSDRIQTLGGRMARFIEDRFGYYALLVPPGVDRGQQPFLSLALAAELAGCGSRSLAGPVLHPRYGFMFYAAVITTLPLPADGMLEEPACPAPECLQQWQAEATTPCLAVCPIDDNGCLGGSLDDGRIVEQRYDAARCRTRVETYWIPGFQKVLESTLREPDKEKQTMMLYSTLFTRSLWSMTYANVSQGQCSECMRVCPVGKEHRTKR